MVHLFLTWNKNIKQKQERNEKLALDYPWYPHPDQPDS